MISFFSKIINRYNNLSAPAKASLFFLFANIVNKGIAFISTPLFTRIMSQEQYGLISVYNSWFTIVSVFATFEFPSGVFNKAMIKYERDRDGYTSSMLFLSSVCTGALLALYLLIHSYINKFIGLPTNMVVLMFIDIFSTSAVLFWTIRERFEYHYKGVVLISVGTNVLATLTSVLFVVYGPEDKAFSKVVGLVLVHVIIYSFLFFNVFRKGKKIVNLDYWRYSFFYNLPLIPHYLSQQVLNQSDRIMIASMCGKADTAAYSLTYQIAAVMQIVTSAIHASFMPWTFQKIKVGESKAIGKRALQLEIFIGLVCVLFSLFAPEFVLILGGKQYYRAVYIVPPVSMSVLFITICDFFGNIEFYFEKTKFVMIASSIVAVLNVVLNAFMIPMYGFVAAGYTTLVCYILYSIVHYLFMLVVCSHNNIESPYNGVKLWSIAAVFTILSIVVLLLYNNTAARYIFIVCVVIIFAGIVKKRKLDLHIL